MALSNHKISTRLRYKLIYMAIIAAPLVFHLLLVGGGALLYSALPSAATSSDVAQVCEAGKHRTAP